MCFVAFDFEKIHNVHGEEASTWEAIAKVVAAGVCRLLQL